MSRINRSRTTPVHNVTVADFVEHTFFPHIEGRRNLSTVHTHRLYWNKQLRPRCGGTVLRDFSTPDVQLLLDHIARVNPEMKRATLYRLKVSAKRDSPPSSKSGFPYGTESRSRSGGARRSPR
jgi:hypothetical protein